MEKLASLDNSVIFKKAFTNKEILSGFVKDILDVDVEFDKIETEKQFEPKIGLIDFRYDIYAEDNKHNIIVEIQKVKNPDHYDRFLHYHMMAIAKLQKNYLSYKLNKTVYTFVWLIDKDEKYPEGYMINDFDLENQNGVKMNIHLHKIIYLNRNYFENIKSQKIKDWLKLVDETIEHPESPDINEENLTIKKVSNVIKYNDISGEEWFRIKEDASNKEGMKEKEEKGIKQKTIEIAKNLLDVLDIETISKKTGLTKEEIENLK